MSSVDFNYEKTPNTPVYVGVVTSMSVPFYFRPNIIDGKMYVDGGVLNNFPLDNFDTIDEKGRKIENPNTLGFMLCPAKELKEGHHYSRRSIKRFSLSILNGLLDKITEHHYEKELLKPERERRLIQINTGTVKTLDFSLNDFKKETLVDYGHKATHRFFQVKVDDIDDFQRKSMQTH